MKEQTNKTLSGRVDVVRVYVTPILAGILVLSAGVVLAENARMRVFNPLALNTKKTINRMYGEEKNGRR